MENIIIREIKRLRGKIPLPADKSISHRSVIIGSISKGTTKVSNFLKSEDCLNTVEVFKLLGINIFFNKENQLIIESKGLRGLKQPEAALYFGNSGTGCRLTAGILAGQSFKSKITGDESLSKRPMRRITDPLRKMGAEISGKDNANYLPLEIKGGRLKSIEYDLPIASAQVKSSILLAGLYARGRTCLIEPHKSRDHTERMLKSFGAKIEVEGLKVCIESQTELTARDISIPNDISAASFFMIAACIVGDSEIYLEGVGINPTRSAILQVLRKMGADIRIIHKDLNSYEPIADIIVKSSRLKAIKIGEEMVPLLIDELPILMVAATQAQGRTLIENASELRVKETDRIESMVTNLKKLGANIKSIGDDVIIEGPVKLKGAEVSSFSDHRTAMSMSIAGLIAEGKTQVDNIECIKTSFPDFHQVINKIIS
ncbi:MAG TPA: 3-phosphoshikimate 1-carboxyvinyltransferase [Candidatus Omnitrophica bacterium]|nr:3-phosphoshikimate 1-carboxyvinyltransferase [Candidatus Omnitrophota bacterium]